MTLSEAARNEETGTEGWGRGLPGSGRWDQTEARASRRDLEDPERQEVTGGGTATLTCMQEVTRAAPRRRVGCADPEGVVESWSSWPCGGETRSSLRGTASWPSPSCWPDLLFRCQSYVISARKTSERSPPPGRPSSAGAPGFCAGRTVGLRYQIIRVALLKAPRQS